MTAFKNRIQFFFQYYFLWIAYFFFARLFFLLFYYNQSSQLGFYEIAKTFIYGFRLDASFTGYLSVIPFFLILLSLFIPKKGISFVLKTTTYLALIIINLLMIIDTTLYQSWGIRIDSTLLNYLNTPEIMWATASTFQIVSGTIVWVLFSSCFILLFKRVINKEIKKLEKNALLAAPFLLIVIAALIIPIRGGFQVIPINQSNVYFSNNMFGNHAAVNFMWNFTHSISSEVSTKNPYKKFDASVANRIIDSRQKSLLTSTKDSILNTKRPNVILIIWESLTGKLVGSIGGEPNVTENLNRLSKEGVLFTNFYANGDRTDKGLIAILSGYYPQTNKSIIKMPNKNRTLPMLTKSMIDAGYNTSFYYGGDLNFGNMNTYLRNAGVTNFIDGDFFDKEDWNSKWGAHDHVFMEKFTADLKGEQAAPFFKIGLTLTSHEPFEFPGTYKFGKDTEENKFRSSHAYTDKTIGKFIENAKKQPWWDNTLIVIIADHGHRTPKHEGVFNSPKKFKIPMLWLGGALQKTNVKINTIASQVDFSYTLLDLLDIDNTDYIWSKNLFNGDESQYAHYIFNNGFGTIDKNGVFVYDFVSNKPILTKGTSFNALDSLGKAITQDAYQDFIER
jgi:phosphoglycerol transferase MdoB-like AlkP superfamily enzyme